MAARSAASRAVILLFVRLPLSWALTVPHANAAADFLNTRLPDFLLACATKLTDVGAQARAKNGWSRGLWKIESADVKAVEPSKLHLSVSVQERGRPESTFHATTLDFSAAASSVDELQLELIRLALRAGSEEGAAALLDLPGASNRHQLPPNLWLNTTPCPRPVRVLIYEDVVAATLSAIGDPAVSRRMRITVTPPELNMEMDSYRVGTLLELVREMALGLYREGKRVRVCVQGSMGTGVFTSLPRALGGVAKVLRMMDWQAEPGEVNDGALGTVQRDLAEGEEAVEGPIRFGAVGADEVRADDDVLLLIAPQNMVGVSLFDALGGMAEAAAHRPMVIINPLLDDRPSSGGLMSVRGRAERTKFYESFEQIYTFRLLYSGTDFMFPIRGAIRMSRASGGLYVVYQRLEDDDAERYEPVGVFETPPCAESLTRLVRRPDDLR